MLSLGQRQGSGGGDWFSGSRINLEKEANWKLMGKDRVLHVLLFPELNKMCVRNH